MGKSRRITYQSPVHLGAALEAGYGNKKGQRHLARRGFIRDTGLSNDHNQVWVHPRSKKMIFIVPGTHDMQDVQTDLLFGIGGHSILRQTKRYQESKNILERARSKYKDYDARLVGHSLGGAIVGDLASNSGIQAVTYNRAATSTAKPNLAAERAFRTGGDLVSFAAAAQSTTLSNNGAPTGIVASHNTANLRTQPIFL